MKEVVLQRLGRLALWSMPLLVIFEWVGGTFYKSIPVRLLYLSLFLGLFWLTDLTPCPALSLGKARRPLGALSLAVGAIMLGCAVRWLLGPLLFEQSWLPPVWLNHTTYRLLLPLLAAWPLVLGSSWLRGDRGALSARTYEQLGCLCALAFVLHMLSGVRVQSLPVLANEPGDRWLLLVCAAVLLGLGLVARGSSTLRFAAIVLAGFVLRVRGIQGWDIEPRVRDMLALVESAQDRFFAGHDPYVFYAMQHGSELPLTYFPGLWLGYAIPRTLGLDFRLMGPLLEVCFLVVLAATARRIEAPRRAWAEAFVSCFAAVWLFSPSVQWNAIYAEPSLWWGLLGLLLTCVYAGRWWPAALLLGYAVATRHFAIVLAPFVLLYFVRARGLKNALPALALAAGLAALMLLPFVLVSPELFWFGTFRWLREYGPAHITWFFDRFGFMQLFHERGRLDLLPYAQTAVVLVCLLGALLTKRLERIASYAATASLLFIMLNVLLWDSFLLDGAVAAAGVVVTRPLMTAQHSSSDPSRRTLQLSMAALGLVLLVGGYLAFTLVRTLHPAGRDEAHDFMVSAVRPGDVVIDRSDRRVAFVEGTWLLRREEVPAPIGGELYDPAWGGGSALAAKGKVWLVTQHRRDAALRESFGKLGKQVESRALGDYRVLAIEPQRSEPMAVASAPTDAGPRRCQLGWVDQTMLGVPVSAARPSVVEFVLPTAASAQLLTVGFANHDVVWPHADVEARFEGGASYEVRNLVGLQWFASALPQRRPLRLALTTSDPSVRVVCLQVLALH